MLSEVVNIPYSPCVLNQTKKIFHLSGGAAARQLKVNPLSPKYTIFDTQMEPGQCFIAFLQITPPLAFGLVKDSSVSMSQVCSLSIVYMFRNHLRP